MPAEFVAFITRLRCPECGAPLFSSGSEVWCSRQGSADNPGCGYGLRITITVRQHLDAVQTRQILPELAKEKHDAHW